MYQLRQFAEYPGYKYFVTVIKKKWRDGNYEIKGNRVYDLSGEKNRKLCRLHLALLNHLGVPTQKFGDAETGRLSWVPNNTIALDEGQASTLMNIVEVLEDNDDVQYVVTNADISDEVMEKLAS